MSQIRSLSGDITRLGVEKGDIVLVRASLKKIGIPGDRIGEALINALLDAVGDEGTIIGLTFTRNFFIPLADRKHVFDARTPSTSGGFANAMLQHPKVVRSTHPTNSYAAIGKYARGILDTHNESSTCFMPIEKLVEMNGKMILVGCIEDSPGFTTVHLAQEKLGLSSRSLLRGLVGAYYRQNSKVRLFVKKDFGGCSRGFYKLYDHYIKNGKLLSGAVGNAPSIAIKAKDAFEIDYALIRDDNKYPLCDNQLCLSCRGTWLYNKGDMAKYYLKTLPLSLIKKAERP